MNTNYYGKRSMALISTGTVNMQRIHHAAMDIANEKVGYAPDWAVISVLRTQQEQVAMWSLGRDSNGIIVDIDKVITYADGVVDLSKHQTGNASDIVPLDKNGKADWSETAMALVACCYLEAALREGIKLSWGGNFTTIYDGGHFEIED